MKKYKDSNFYIQHTNKHLLNILEDNYYIELGQIDIQVLTKIIDSEPIEFKDIYSQELLLEGIGQINENSQEDMFYQLNYLISLRQKRTSYKFFITFGTILYKNEQGEEKYAPVILIPVEISYKDLCVISSNEPVLNRLLLRIIARKNNLDQDEQNKYITDLLNLKFNSIIQMDKFVENLAKHASMKYDLYNYLTVCDCDYVDYNVPQSYFSYSQMMYDYTYEEIYKRYFNECYGVMPTNIYQKFALLKAANLESFVIDGRIGCGKTYTALNIALDFIRKGKRVLYVNTDIDRIIDFENLLLKKSLDNHFINLVQMPDKNQLDFDKNIKLNDTSNELNPFVNLFDYVEKFNGSTDGLKNLYIIEQFAYVSRVLENKQIIKLPLSLQGFEIKRLYMGLKEVEEIFKEIDNYPKHIFKFLIANKSHYSVLDINDLSQNLYNIHTLLTRKVKDISLKYNFTIPKNIYSVQRFILDVVDISTHSPVESWKDKSVLKSCKNMLLYLKDLSDEYYTLDEYYKSNIKDTYDKSKAKDLFSQLISPYLEKQSSDQQRLIVNRLLSIDGRLEKFTKELDYNIYHFLRLERKIKDYLNLSQLSTSDLNLIEMLYNYVSSEFILKSWIELYTKDSAKFKSQALIMTKKMNEISRKKDTLQKFFNNEFIFSFKELFNIFDVIKDKKIIKKHINLKELRKSDLTIDDIYSQISDYYTNYKYIYKEIIDKEKINLDNFNEYIKKYIGLYDFDLNMGKREKNAILGFFKKYLLNYNEQSTFIKDLKGFLILYDQIDRSTSFFNNFNIEIEESVIEDRLNAINNVLDYLQNAISVRDELTVIFKNKKRISYEELTLLLKNDQKLAENKNKLAESDARFRVLFGEYYNGYETIFTSLIQSIEYFQDFYERFNDLSDLNNVLEPNNISSLVGECYKLSDIHSRYVAIYRNYSACFRKSISFLQSLPLDDASKILENYLNNLDDVPKILKINSILADCEKFKLKGFSEDIQHGTIKSEIANIFLYNVLAEKIAVLRKTAPELFDSGYFYDAIDNYTFYENNYCAKNTMFLRNINDDKLKLLHHENYIFNDYNKIISLTNKHSLIYLADVSIINSSLDLSSFDLMIIDDAELGRANDFNRIKEVKQTIVLGDKLAKSSFVNTLMQRINEKSFLHFDNRYLKMNNAFNNTLDLSNKYAFDENHPISITEYLQLNDFVLAVINRYMQNANHLINIVVGDESSRRDIYESLIKNLKSNFSNEEIIKIVSKSIRVINGINENTNFVDDIYIYYNDFIYSNQNTKKLILKNSQAVRKNLEIAYLKNSGDMENDIDDLIGKPKKPYKNNSPLAKVIKKDLGYRKIKTRDGFGIFDFIILNKTITGVAIIGAEESNSFCFIDDFLYYKELYRLAQFNTIIIFANEVINDYDEVIKKIVTSIKGEKK